MNNYSTCSLDKLLVILLLLLLFCSSAITCLSPAVVQHSAEMRTFSSDVNQYDLPFIGADNKYKHEFGQGILRARAAAHKRKTRVSRLEPIILIPGLGGSRLQATKKDVKDEPHWWCEKTTSEPYSMWIALQRMVPYATLGCFLHDFQPHYDTEKRVISSTSGVTVFPYKFGDVDGVTYLVDHYEKSQYMQPMIQYFEMHGYKAGHSIRAAPYDFRMGFSEYSQPGNYFSQLRDLVEDTYARNNGSRVHLLGHSLGGPLANFFLVKYVSQEWKDKYIASLMPIGPPFGGAPITAALAFTGVNYGIPTLKNSDLLKVIRQSGTIAAMFPRSGPKTTPLIRSSRGNYTTDRVTQFFKDIGDQRYVSLLDRELSENLAEAPRVPVYCIYGLGYATPSEFTITDFSDPSFDITGAVDGDQTVPAESLKLCDKFSELQDEPVNVWLFSKNSSHIEIIYNPDVWDKILSVTIKN